MRAAVAAAAGRDGLRDRRDACGTASDGRNGLNTGVPSPPADESGTVAEVGAITNLMGFCSSSDSLSLEEEEVVMGAAAVVDGTEKGLAREKSNASPKGVVATEKDALKKLEDPAGAG